MSTMQFPHLKDVQSVRQEAAAQYGGLNDAAQLIQAHRAGIDPNLEATALRKRNVKETQKLADSDHEQAQAKIDEAYGEGRFTVLDSAVRGHALSVVAEDNVAGRPVHLVVGWSEKWKPVATPAHVMAARANAATEAAKTTLGSEARAEVERLVRAATAEIMQKISGMFGDRMGEIESLRDEAIDDAVKQDEAEQEQAASAAPFSGAFSEGGGAKWPRSHEALDRIAAERGVVFSDDAKINDKIRELEAAGVTPEAADEQQQGDAEQQSDS